MRGVFEQLYQPSLALMTDLYQLTMAYGYWKCGHATDEAVFHMSIRETPFGGGYAVACGLGYLIDYLSAYRFSAEDLAFLAVQKGNDGRTLFDAGFLEYLGGLTCDLDIDAIPEGTVIFPHEPLVRVRGCLPLCQMIETPLLNMINFQTLIASKAARICDAAGDDPVLEFGLRRAQGFDGALAASRAAYVGGCAGTSNVLAGRIFGIPVRGTHAHSWVMTFEDELSAFEAYAKALPNNCVFLVDTYDTLQGVRNAIHVASHLRQQGHAVVGVRLDSGDLTYLSRKARQMLDDAGFPEAVVVASNDLDEEVIGSLKAEGAAIAVWGVGTRLVTGDTQAALGGVYKLSAIKPVGSRTWRECVKVSQQPIKTSTPGILQVRRYHDGDAYVGDLIYDVRRKPPEAPTIVDPLLETRRKQIRAGTPGKDLLLPVFRKGRCVYDAPSLEQSRAHCREELARLHPGIRRRLNPHAYPAGLELSLYARKAKMIRDALKLA